MTRIHTFLQYEWSDETNEYVLVHEEGFDCPESGVAWCKGASSAQDQLAASQSAFYNQLTNNYSTQFANQNAILSSLQSSLASTVAAGPSQFGFSPGQTDALNSTAIQGTAQSYQNAEKALQNNAAQQGGGNVALPSGVAAQNAATLAASGANQESSELLGIKNAGYTQGNANYNNAINALGGVASQYNPNGVAGNATGAGNAAANEANVITQENNAASPWGAIGGLLGGVAGAFAGPLGASVGSSIGKSLGGAASGSGTTNSDSLSSWGL
jgi:hypothetical protein